MGKARYDHHPRAVIQNRTDHPATLSVTIPKRTVQAMDLKKGDILEFVAVTEGHDSFVKVRKAA